MRFKSDIFDTSRQLQQLLYIEQCVIGSNPIFSFGEVAQLVEQLIMKLSSIYRPLQQLYKWLKEMYRKTLLRRFKSFKFNGLVYLNIRSVSGLIDCRVGNLMVEEPYLKEAE